MPLVPFFRSLGFASTLLTAVGVARSGDWPQWRGPMRTGHLPQGDELPRALAAEPKVVWRVKVGEGFASPVVAAGRVFVFDHQSDREVLHALAVDNGREHWRAEIDDAFKDSQGPPGPRCTPLVDGDRVYAQSCRGELQCRDVGSGRLLWNTNYVRDFGAVFTGEKGSAPGATRHGNNGSPVIHGDWLYASVGSTHSAGMVCFHKRTGAVRWKSGDEIAAYAAPIVAPLAGRLQVINFMADALTAFDAGHGRPLWRIPVKTDFARHVTTPVVEGNRVIVSSHQYGLFAIEVTPSPVNPAEFSAREVWRNTEAAMNFSSPVAVGGFLYGLGPKKTVVCVELATGKTLWRQEGWITSSAEKAHAGFLTDGQSVLMLGDDGMLFQFAADAGQARELGRAQVCRVNWCNPALADGRLYLRDNLKGPGELLALELR
jgi:outer membrane protein assembly factor BamB